MDRARRYKAFISYSHTDQKSARWLHNTLETFRVPGRLVGTRTPVGTVPSRLGPIFIDRKELSPSGSLTAAVREALEQSEFLIVVCSPEAARSRWVNQEIIEFKRIRGEASIHCVIVDGEPFASRHADGSTNGESEECFPLALRYRINADGQLTDEPVEPIAADLRPGGDGKRMVRLKMVASLIGVGLDELIQREAQRHHRRLFGLTAASLTGMLIMSVLTLTAISARKDAEQARSATEQQRAEAEDLIEFMLGELRSKLGPVGRLEILDAVGQKALGYYAAMSPGDLDSSSLSRRARALQLLGEIQGLRGNFALASRAIAEAHQTTAELLDRAPHDAQAIYNHAQSTYWVGFIEWQRGNQGAARQSFLAYLELAERLTIIDPANATWRLELGYANSNMGSLLMDQGNWSMAIEVFSTARRIFAALTLEDPTRLDWQVAVADTHSWLSSALLESGQLTEARVQRQQELKIYQSILARDPNNADANYQLVPAHMHLARLSLMSGEVDAALSAFEQALQMSQLRMRDDPENSTSAQLTGSIYLDYAEAFLGVGRSRQAEQALVRADEISKDLLQKDPSILRWQADLRCRGLIVRARLNLQTGNPDNGFRYNTLAIDELVQLQTGHPDNQGISLLLANAHLNSGRLLEALDQPLKARAAWERTRAILAPIGARLKPDARADLAWANFYLGREAQARDIISALDRMGYHHPDFIDLMDKWDWKEIP